MEWNNGGAVDPDPGWRKRRLRRRALLLGVPAAAALALVGLGVNDMMGPDYRNVNRDKASVAVALNEVRTGTCPAAPPEKTTSDVASHSQLLAALHPTRMLLCGYGTERRPMRVSAVVTDPATLSRLRDTIDRLPPAPGGRMVCPDSYGGFVLAVFTDGRHVMEVIDNLTGCSVVSDGARDRSPYPPDVESQFLRLLPPAFATSLRPG